MTHTISTLAERADAIRARLADAYPFDLGYGSFYVRTSRPRKHHPRVLVVSWSTYPFEAQVAEVLGDLTNDEVTYERTQMWSCGIRHADAMEAWKAHEGNHWLTYPDDGYGGRDYEAEMELPEDVEAELRAGGETFESDCVPGNYTTCPTCGGGAVYMPSLGMRPRTLKNLRYEPCPDCVRLGTDRQTFRGILNLDNPEHLGFYEETFEEREAIKAGEAKRAETKRTKALAQPAATAKPTWLALPSRAGGLLNGIPVPSAAPGCDYLTDAESPSCRVRCNNDAKWFDPTTGLRVCTRHKTAGRKAPTG